MAARDSAEMCASKAVRFDVHFFAFLRRRISCRLPRCNVLPRGVHSELSKGKTLAVVRKQVAASAERLTRIALHESPYTNQQPDLLECMASARGPISASSTPP
jgi:hypothetical protein